MVVQALDHGGLQQVGEVLPELQTPREYRPGDPEGRAEVWSPPLLLLDPSLAGRHLAAEGRHGGGGSGPSDASTGIQSAVFSFTSFADTVFRNLYGCRRHWEGATQKLVVISACAQSGSSSLPSIVTGPARRAAWVSRGRVAR